MSGGLNELARFISAPGAYAVKALFSEKGFIPITLGTIRTELGVALTTQATTVTGLTQLSNKETVINIPVNTNPATGKELGFTVPIPLDIDTAYPLQVKVLIGKAAALDALTLDCEVFPVAAGDVGNSDIQATAATTITETPSVLTFTCTASSMLPPPGGLSVVLLVGGTNDGDAVYIYNVWLEYTKLLLNG